MKIIKLKQTLMVCAALLLSSIGQKALSEADLYRLVWTDDPSSTMTIGWRQHSGTFAAVQYRVKGTSIWNEHTDAIVRSFQNTVADPDDAAHTLTSTFVTLTGLSANTDYEFRIVEQGDIYNTTYWFRTAPDSEEVQPGQPTEFNFVAGGDSRPDYAGDPDDVARTWGNRLVAKIRPLFILFNGDYHDVGAYDEWLTWLTQWQLTISSDNRMYPIVPAHGNHENDVPDMVQKIFNVAQEDAYYALNVGGNLMRLYTLNSELEKGVGYSSMVPHNDDESRWNAQSAWLQQDLNANSAATWKVASYHRPLRPHTGSKAEGAGRYDVWADAFDTYGVNLAIESDSHMVKYTYPVVPCTTEAGCFDGFKRDDVNGTVYIGEGAWGAPKRPIDDDKPWTMASDSLWHLHVVQASPSALTVRSAVFQDEANDVTAVAELSQAEQDADPHALPSGLNIWNPLSGEAFAIEQGQAFDSSMLDASNVTLIESQSTWKYLDDGSDLGTSWTGPAFDDTAWASGPAELGYGDGDEVTLLSFGPDSGDKFRTTYFRNSFTVADASKVIQLIARIKRDDGAVVYINGTEVLRSNMPEGAITSTTFASAAIGGSGESDYNQFYLLTDALVDGVNTIAVEIHQSDAGSSDISFDLNLLAVTANMNDTAPAAVSDLTAFTVPDETDKLQLDWSPAPAALGQQLERQSSVGNWNILEPRLSASLAEYLDISLPEGSSQSYRLRSYNSSGLSVLSNVAEGTTFTNPVPVILSETFQTPSAQGTFGQFSTISITSNANWQAYEYPSGSGEYFARINGYGADEASDDWLISPAFNLRFYQDEFVNVETARNFDGPDLEILYSFDYDPEVHTNPASATWNVLTTNIAEAGGYVFESTGDIDLSGPGFDQDTVYIGFHYISTGTGGGDGQVWEVDNFSLRGTYSPPVLLSADFEGATLNPFNAFSAGSNADWVLETRAGSQGAIANGFGADGPSDDWLISTPLEITESMNAVLNFDYYSQYGGPMMEVYISNASGAQCPAANDVAWTELEVGMDQAECSSGCTWQPIKGFDISSYTGSNVCIAFRYLSTGTGGGDGRRWGVDNVSVTESLPSMVEASFSVVSAVPSTPMEFTTVEGVEFLATVTNGVEPLTYLWTFGDGQTSGEAQPTHTYSTPGTYTPSLQVTDANGATASFTGDELTIIQSVDVAVPAKLGQLRVATFNAAMAADPVNDDLVSYLSDSNRPNIKAIAEIIQHANADVILINEFDYDAAGQAVQLFKDNYLEVPQNNASAVVYPYHYSTRVNTGTQPEDPEFPGDGDLDIDADFNNNGATDDPDDAYGFGEYPGQYGMLILSKYPIDTANIRTLQKFLWKDMPGNLLPTQWYDAAEQDMFRLSSKSHWDVPVLVNGETVHVLTSHPTPPVFDGPEDRNGRRNYDEIRLWADYIDPSVSGYIYDDNGVMGGLPANTRFVIMGDQNADPDEGDAYLGAIDQLLLSPLVDDTNVPTSLGAGENAPSDTSMTDTASWGLRADYVLPSQYGLTVEQNAVFWPQRADVKFHLVSGDISSDHRLVWVDLNVLPAGDANEDGQINVMDLRFVAMNLRNSAEQCQSCDVNGDGTINALDLRALNLLMR